MNGRFDDAINYMSKIGYQITSQSENKVQLVKPEKKSCLLLILLFIAGVIPAIFYAIITKDRSLMISAYPDRLVAIDERGKQKSVPYNEIKRGDYSVLLSTRFPWLLLGILLGLFIWYLLISGLTAGTSGNISAFLFC